MKVRMLQDMSGNHDGQPYLSRGEVDDLDEAHAQDLIDAGAAVAIGDGDANGDAQQKADYADAKRKEADAANKEAADALAVANQKAQAAAVAGAKANEAEQLAKEALRGAADLSVGAQAHAEVVKESAPVGDAPAERPIP